VEAFLTGKPFEEKLLKEEVVSVVNTVMFSGRAFQMALNHTNTRCEEEDGNYFNEEWKRWYTTGRSHAFQEMSQVIGMLQHQLRIVVES